MLAGGATLALAGCGEIKNTITAVPGTADTLTVALPSAPGPWYVGIYEAQTLGYLRQADLNVRLVTPSGSAVTDPLPALENRQVKVALSSEPAVFAARNDGQALVSVAAVVNGPLKRNVKVTTKRSTTTTGGASVKPSKTSSSRTSKTTSKSGSGSSSGSTTKTTVTYENVPELSLLPPELRSRKDLPTYDGLVMVVRKETIVNRPALIRRFVQAVARGYRAALANPTRAIQDLIRANPALAAQRAQVVGGVQWVLSASFPGGGHPWGWQNGNQWNAFGTWMYKQKLVTNANAVAEASTNELLAGQGV